MSIELVVDDGVATVMEENGSLVEGEEIKTTTTSICLGLHGVEVSTMQQNEGYGPPSLDIVIRGPSGFGSGCVMISISAPAASSSPRLPKPPEQVTLEPGSNGAAFTPPSPVPPPQARLVSYVDAPLTLSLQPTPRRSSNEREEEEEEEKRRTRDSEEWLRKMRGWLMVVSILLASAAYQAGTSPQDFSDFFGVSLLGGFMDLFFTICNSAALGLSLGSIILLMGETTFHGRFKLMALRVFVVGAIFALAVAYSCACYHSIIGTVVFLGFLLIFLLFVTWLTWWYNRNREQAMLRRLHSLGFAGLVRRVVNGHRLGRGPSARPELDAGLRVVSSHLGRAPV